MGKKDNFLNDADKLMQKIEDAISRKDWQTASNDCESLLKIMPRSFKARFYLGNIYFTTGQVPKAIERYKKDVTVTTR